jgi:hypothetical protein
MFDSLAPGHFGNVDESFNSRLQLDESAVIGDIDHLARHTSANRINLTHQRPRIRSELFIPEGNAFFFPIVLEDLYSDLITDIEHL